MHCAVDFYKLKENDGEDIELYEYHINEQWQVGKDWYDYKYGFKHIDRRVEFLSYEEARLECLKELIKTVENGK